MDVPLLAELQRRRVFRVLVGYGVASFAVLQIIEPIMHALHLPDVTLTYVVLALAVGFPVAVVLAWAFDINEGKIERTKPASSHALKGARLPLVLVGVGLLAAAPGVVWYAHGRAANQSVSSPVTLAVLPLVNLSGDASQEYFSDGLTEEIVGKLSRLRSLAVTARISVAKYKGSTAGAQEIGAELHVAYLLEGSVRRAGDRIRVSATLVDAANSFRVWSEEIDGKLDDVFAVQERIATRIVDALHLKLSPEETMTLSNWGTRDPAAYDEYLQGQALLEHFHLRDRLDAAHAHFDRALAIDPQFAPAMAGLADTEAQLYRNFDSDPRRQARGESLVARALALDPRLTAARLASANISATRYDYARASTMVKQVVADEPRNYYAWDLLCWSLSYERPAPLAEAEDACRRSLGINPGYAEPWYHLARVLIAQGRITEGEQALNRLEEHFPGSSLIESGRFWLFMATKRPREALAAARGPTALSGAWEAMALAEANEIDQAFAKLDDAMTGGYRDIADLQSSPYFAPLRADPRFGPLLTKHGLGP